MIHLAFVFAAATGSAYVDVRRIEAMPAVRGFFAAYDRETASLKATQNVPRLTDTRPVAQHQALVVQNGAREANAALDVLQQRASAYAPRVPDAASIGSRIEANYEREASAVQANASASAGQYRAELERETATELRSYHASLDVRVNNAYRARAQELREKEAELQIKLDRQDANQDLLLRVKLQNLKSPQVNRGALRARLVALEGRENRAIAALQAADARTLAAYRAKLLAAASRDDASMSAELRRKAQANWQLRQRVSQAQMQAPERLSLAPLQGLSFTDRWSHFGTDATATGAAFTSGADDIARRFSAIGDMDTQARGSASNEIIALQRDRAGLHDELAREAQAIARRLAAQRGLTLIGEPQPGAVDLTAEVVKQLRAMFSP